MIDFKNLPDTSTPLSADLLNQMQSELLLAVYPVGSIYMSVNNINPGTLFGGTWVAWGAGRVPVGVDTSQPEFDTAEETGGEKTHTLTVQEMPNHSHDVNVVYPFDFGGKVTAVANSNSDSIYRTANDVVISNGGGQAHNNLQPYITCYMWKRVADASL